MVADFFNLILEAFLVEILLMFFIVNVPNSVMLRMKMFFGVTPKLFQNQDKAHSQLSQKCVNKFCSPSFCAILSSRKNFSNVLCLIMKILIEKNPLYYSLPSSPATLFYLDYHPRPHKVRDV